MQLLQFAVPERIGSLCAEVVTTIAGGATLVSAMGWWINGDGVVERERVSWLVVGVEDSKIEELLGALKGILKNAGEQAIFYAIGSEARLEWL